MSPRRAELGFPCDADDATAALSPEQKSPEQPQSKSRHRDRSRPGFRQTRDCSRRRLRRQSPVSARCLATSLSARSGPGSPVGQSPLVTKRAPSACGLPASAQVAKRGCRELELALALDRTSGRPRRPRVAAMPLEGSLGEVAALADAGTEAGISDHDRPSGNQRPADLARRLRSCQHAKGRRPPSPSSGGGRCCGPGDRVRRQALVRRGLR